MRTLTSIALLLSCMAAHAQPASAVYTDPAASLKQAKDLYNRALYTSAKRAFDEIAHSSLIAEQQRTDAQLYYALCALELQQPEGITLVRQFEAEHPENPQTSQAGFALGKMLFIQGDYAAAIEAFNDANTNGLSVEQKTAFHYFLGYSHYTQKNYSAARQNFEIVQDYETQYAQSANYYLGIIAYEKKDYAAAIKAFKKIEKGSYAKEVPYYIAQIYYEQKKYDELITYAKPLTQDPSQKNADKLNLLLGQAHYQKKQYDQAIPYLKNYINTARKAVKPEEYYQYAYTAYQQKMYDDAINGFKNIAAQNTKLGQNAAYLMGDSHLKLNEKEKARTSFAQASKPDFDKEIKEIAAFNYAKLCYELNVQTASLDALQDFVATYPKSKYADEAKELIGEVLLSTRNYDQAIKVLEAMPNKNSNTRRTYQKVCYYKATDLFNENQPNEAIKYYNKALSEKQDATIGSLANFWKGDALYLLKKYDEARKSYQAATPNAQISQDKINYHIGYALYNHKEYKAAIPYFEKTSNNPANIANDAKIRLADTYFATNNYNKAAQIYQTIIANKSSNTDYALYQQAIILGLGNDDNEKTVNLQRITKDFAQSSYADDAYLELANMALSNDQYTEAENYLETLTTKYPNSPILKDALNKKALTYYNQNKKQEALNTYKQVATQYPKTPEAQDALAGIKNIYVDMNEVDEYFKFVKTIPGANVDASQAAQDSLNFSAIEQVYEQNNCTKTIAEITKYLSKYPNSVFGVNARFMRGDCYLQGDKNDLALADFEYITKQPRSSFTEKSLLQVAQLYQEKNNYATALATYKNLSQIAENKRTKLLTQVGLCRCAYEENQLELANGAASNVLTNTEASDQQKNEARLIQGKIAYKNNNFTLANQLLAQVYAADKSSIGAEAKYYTCEILYKQNQLKACQDAIFELVDATSNDYWITKGFLLLSDTYIQENNLFQAKATLESIVENHQGAVLKAEAQAKLKRIEQLEKQ